MIELGASSLGYRHDSLDVALREISALGFHRCDIVMISSYCAHFNPVTASADEKARLQARLKELGLSIATLNVGDGLLGIPAQRESALKWAIASLEFAKQLGGYAITIQSGVEPRPGEWLEVARAVAPDLRTLGNHAAGLGLDLTLELHKAMLMANSQEALDLMEMIDHPCVGVALDPSHSTYAGEKAAEVALRLGSHVKHVHLRDGAGKNILVVPGDGSVDFTALAAALEKRGYNRVASIELEYKHVHAERVSVDLARAKTFLERSFKTGIPA
jgi:sugar phosphate isomerase/epimerase